MIHHCNMINERGSEKSGLRHYRKYYVRDIFETYQKRQTFTCFYITTKILLKQEASKQQTFMIIIKVLYEGLFHVSASYNSHNLLLFVHSTDLFSH